MQPFNGRHGPELEDQMSACRNVGLVTAVFLAAATLTGCGSGSPFDSNQGGDTQCGDFREMTPDDQREVVVAYLEEKGNSNPAGYEVTLTLESSKLFCTTLGAADDPIRKIETG